MTDLLELSERIWTGEVRIEEHSPFAPQMELAEIDAGSAFVSSFGNVSAFETQAGLVLIDTGIIFAAPGIIESLRGWNQKRINSVIYSHGHVDHTTGMKHIAAHAQSRGEPIPKVIAHEAVGLRFDRYVRTAGYNSVINYRQFQVEVPWPVEYHFPDETYLDNVSLEIGGVEFELHHARGETDDHTWTWLPERRILATGDLFIWVSPNAGNPQKVQRYPDEWAAALREMATLQAEILLPGHGLPIVGVERVKEALSKTAELLESLVEQTLSMMNTGATLDEIIHSVRSPDDLLDKPYLRPIYDEPEFIVRNIWRLYGGWFDGTASHLKPAPEVELAKEIASLTGGPLELARRASELADEGTLRLACHLADWAALAAPSDAQIQEIRADVYEKRLTRENSLMTRGIFSWAARSARENVSTRKESSGNE